MSLWGDEFMRGWVYEGMSLWGDEFMRGWVYEGMSWALKHIIQTNRFKNKSNLSIVL
jgi:hypothetical protein